MEINLNSVKNKLELLTCSTGSKYPIVKVNGSKLNFEYCSGNFSKKSIESNAFLTEDEKRAIIESLNKAFTKLK